MSRRPAAAIVALVVAAGCHGPARSPGHRVVLRVSTSDGLSGFVPSTVLSGASNYAFDLQYDSLKQDAVVAGVNGTRVILKPRPGSGHSAKELARSLHFRGLVRAEARGARVIATFESAKMARWFATVEPPAVDLGPFVMTEASPARLRFKRRGHSAISEIDVIEVPGGQQWRRLMGRDIDVVPLAHSIYRDQFAGMSSVRTLDLPVDDNVELFFNTNKIPETDVRRKLAAAIDRRAVARIACGSADCAVTSLAPKPPAGDPKLPSSLTLVVLSSDASAVLAARVIRHELYDVGVAVKVREVDVSALARRSGTGDFDLLIAPRPASQRRLFRWLGRTLLAGVRVRDPAFQKALSAGDLAAMRRILAAEVAIMPLYQQRQFAAVDAHFCGGHPKHGTSWRWLVELHPCK